MTLNDNLIQSRDPDNLDESKVLPVTLFALNSGSGRLEPLASTAFGGGTADTASAREVTLAAVRDAVLAVGNNTDTLEAKQDSVLAKLEQVRVLLAPVALHTIGAHVTMTMTGASQSLPDAPAGATALQVQAQGGDVRYRLDATDASATSGFIYYEGERDTHPFADRLTTRVYGTAGVKLELVWKGP